MFKYLCLVILIIASSSSVQAQSPNDFCTQCTQVFDELKAGLGNKSNQDEIASYLDSFCSKVGQFSEVCKSLVDSNIPSLMETLSNEIDSKSFCDNIGMCSQKRQFQLKNLIPKSIEQKIEINTPCLMCELLLNATADALRNAKNEEYVQKVLDSECFSFGPFYQQCQSFVNKHTKEILDSIASDVDPSVVCPYIGVCPDETSTTTVEPKTTTVEPTATTSEPTTTVENLKINTPCLMCELLLNATADALRNAKNEEYVQKVLDSECFSFGPFYQQCQSFVNKHTKEILDSIASDVDPTEICPYIGLCPNETSTTTDITAGSLEYIDQVDIHTPCLMCELLLNATDNALRNADNIEHVRKALSYECFRLGPFFEECQAFVNNHTREIFEAIAEEIDPSVICPYIGICPKETTTTVEPTTTTVEPATTTVEPTTTTVEPTTTTVEPTTTTVEPTTE